MECLWYIGIQFIRWGENTREPFAKVLLNAEEEYRSIILKDVEDTLETYKSVRLENKVEQDVYDAYFDFKTIYEKYKEEL